MTPVLRRTAVASAGSLSLPKAIARANEWCEQMNVLHESTAGHSREHIERRGEGNEAAAASAQ